MKTQYKISTPIQGLNTNMNKQSSLKVAIAPYFDSDLPNMGLEKYGWVTFPMTEYIEYLSQDVNGRWVTGLDPYSVEILAIEDAEEKAAKIEEIGKIVARLEKVFGEGSLDAKNDSFWSNFYLDVKDNHREIDIKKPKDELLYYAIKAGGFTEIAKTFEEAQNSPKIFKFYLKIDEEEAAIRTQSKKVLGKAKGLLVDLIDADPKKIFYIAKILLPINNEFRFNTPRDILYDKLDRFLDGLIIKNVKKDAPKQFIDVAKLSKTDLAMMALVQDAIFYRMIFNQDGLYVNPKTETKLGRNPKEIIEFLKNPANSSELDNLESRVHEKWNS